MNKEQKIKECQKISKEKNKGKCLCNTILDCPCQSYLQEGECKCANVS